MNLTDTNMGNLQSAASSASFLDCFAVYQSFAKEVISVGRSANKNKKKPPPRKNMAEWGYAGDIGKKR